VTFLTSFHKVTTVSLGTVELAKLTRRRNQSTMAASFMKIHSIKVPMLLQALKKLVWTRAKDDSLSLSISWRKKRTAEKHVAELHLYVNFYFSSLN
jgi:hypothetical protein